MTSTIRRFLWLILPLVLLSLVVYSLIEQDHYRAEYSAALSREKTFIQEQQQKMLNTFALIVSDLIYLTNSWEVHEVLNDRDFTQLERLEKKFAVLSLKKRNIRPGSPY